ncbi:hypothetical protein Kpol_364p2 [Vanderwaltozyma polyspora DSM 70294]|uniref:MIF4G domain-containing protein n=1 Tax=Vanderwaltozyma polyspora (strain ATCC 22028 / DSM 70294 / BCRC 21397 / CBS 2163 / NBRC 10782 / NRRL Y-8283 / UCD 57-17) TaxID=436907 RepID=A7TSB8_VANPO|nr:uncharacterized protein Kpol_364p2 [Vanderwaltozyma polyspora DSM 70294]EDO14830.1 hypothetical protein Kpol_364p2 [Vanderwaltozyma polyspora DSM 70294]
MDNARRLELYELNTKAWVGVDVFLLNAKKLDSSIKRNTGFIKKLKQGITKESMPSLLKDLSEVSLQKYLSEIIVTSNEALTNVGNKNEDIIAAVEVISALHQRFNEQFTERLFELFLHNFNSPISEIDSEKEELTRINKIRGNLRIFTELYLVGIFVIKEDALSKEQLPSFLSKKSNKREPILFNILKETLNYKFKLGYSTIIATSFVKRSSTFFDNDDSSWDSFISDSDLKKLIQSLFKIFTDAVFARVIDLDKKMKKLMKEHQKCQIRTGKLRDEYIEEYDSLSPIYDRFSASSTALAEFFKLEAPIIDNDDTEDIVQKSPMITTQTVTPGQVLWDNDDMRRFYENLPDISNEVEISPSLTKDANNNEAINDFFSSLEMAETKEDIDKLSKSYWSEGLDNKATRKRLLKFFIETQDWSKLRIYARFVATNSKYFPELYDELLNYLDSGFRSQLHSNRINFKNIIFFSEMVKFMLVPKFMIFHKIRTLLMNMNVPNNIEILTVLFEHLGKFLINHSEYQEQMKKMVDLVKERSRDRQLNLNLKGAMDNLYILVYPPSVKTLNSEVKSYTPEQKFYSTMIRRELANTSVKILSKLIQKAHWKDEEIVNTFFDLFTSPEKIPYQNIPIMSKILSDIYVYQRNFVVKCIDQIIENVDRGLETNEYNDNLQRLANIRYLTDIYNSEIIKSDVLMETLYHILKFGHPNSQPNPYYQNSFDLKDNYFRIQLISTSLLSITRITPAMTRKLKVFLRFFEYYIFTKDQPLPKETQFKVTNVYEKYSEDLEFERSANLEESAIRLVSILKINNGVTPSETQLKGKEEDADIIEESDLDDAILEEGSETELSVTDMEGLEDDESDANDVANEGIGSENEDSAVDDYLESSDDDEDEDEDVDEDEDEDEDDESETDDSESDSESDEYDEYRDIDADRDIEKKRMYEEFQKKLKNEDELKAEDELEKQFQAIMSESIDSRKNEKIQNNNIPIVSNRGTFNKPKLLLTKPVEDNAKTSNDGSTNKVAFTFLTKAGKKTQSRTLALPTDLKFVSDVLEEEERLKDERQRIKNIVLQRAFD